MIKKNAMSLVLLASVLFTVPAVVAEEGIKSTEEIVCFTEAPQLNEANEPFDMVRSEDYMRLSDDELGAFINSLTDEENAIVKAFLDLMLGSVSDSLNSDIASQFMALLANYNLQPSISVNISLLKTIDAAIQAA